MAINDFDRGVIAGILIGEGHFGGDGRQPQVTLRMHVRHESLFKWLQARLPGARLYGPYEHSGRRYYQWMARGEVLVREVLPIVEAALAPVLKQLGDDPTPAQILALKVCDPAMGSGAFLVEACRQLGDAYFVLFCPRDTTVATTNLRDIQPLAAALGIDVATP